MFFYLDLSRRELWEHLLSRTRTKVSTAPHPTLRRFSPLLDAGPSQYVANPHVLPTSLFWLWPPIISSALQLRYVWHLSIPSMKLFRFPSQAVVTLITQLYVGVFTLFRKGHNAPCCSFYVGRLLRRESFPPFCRLIWCSDDHQSAITTGSSSDLWWAPRWREYISYIAKPQVLVGIGSRACRSVIVFLCSTSGLLTYSQSVVLVCYPSTHFPLMDIWSLALSTQLRLLNCKSFILCNSPCGNG